MNEIISAVTPLTRVLIWLRGETTLASVPEKAIDYLTDGLLTASLAERPEGNKVLVSQSFGKPLHVLMVRQELSKGELAGFAELIKRDLGAEDNVLVIDEAKLFSDLRSRLPKDLIPRCQVMDWPR